MYTQSHRILLYHFFSCILNTGLKIIEQDARWAAPAMTAKCRRISRKTGTKRTGKSVFPVIKQKKKHGGIPAFFSPRHNNHIHDSFYIHTFTAPVGYSKNTRTAPSSQLSERSYGKATLSRVFLPVMIIFIHSFIHLFIHSFIHSFGLIIVQLKLVF